MSVEIKVPSVGESINEVTLTKWIKNDGDWVDRDEVIAELESEKATFEINAEKAGVLHTIAKENDTLKIGDVVSTIDDTAERPAAKVKDTAVEKKNLKTEESKSASKDSTVSKESKTEEKPVPVVNKDPKATPVAAAILADKKIDVKKVTPTGSNGRIMKHDVLEALTSPGRPVGKELFGREERTEKMSNLRRTISRRLVEAKNSTAMLTTFNEVDMSAIMDLRTKYKEVFKKHHEVNLGFMSFFTKACCFALQEWPAVNAGIDGDNIVYHDYCDISIAVSSPKGLVVPVIRNAESLKHGRN